MVEPATLVDFGVPSLGEFVFEPRIRCHIHSCAGKWQAGPSAAKAVADFAAATCGCAVERLDCGGEVVGLCLERQHGADFAESEIRGHVGLLGCELQNVGSGYEGHIVFVCRYKSARIGLARTLDEVE